MECLQDKLSKYYAEILNHNIEGYHDIYNFEIPQLEHFRKNIMPLFPYWYNFMLDGIPIFNFIFLYLYVLVIVLLS